MNRHHFQHEVRSAAPPAAEVLSLPRAGVEITLFLDGSAHAVTAADLYLLLGRALAVRLAEPLEIGIRIEAGAAPERMPVGEPAKGSEFSMMKDP